MKLFKYLLPLLLITSTAFPQALPIRNDTPTTLRDLGANLNVGKNFAVDQYGQSKIGAIVPGTGATNLGKAEDSPHTTGDVGVMALGVTNEDGSQFAAFDDDYTPIATNRAGAVYGIISNVNLYSGQQPGSIIKSEDIASNASDVGVASMGITEDALSVDQNLADDYGILKLDRVGRLITTLAPAGESFQSCSASNTGTTDIAIKTAVASNRIYVTSIDCSNSSAVPSQLAIKDGATIIAVGGVAAVAVTGGADHMNFPVPLRGTSNTALNFAMTTNATSTVCCASGYVSVN
jgi:hypothetical protein